MAKRLRKILLVLLALLAIVQLPFIYRRYRLGQTAEKITITEQTRSPASNSRFDEYRGVIHVHTNLGEHSTGTFNELIAAAEANDLDFVLMTEHSSDKYDVSSLTLNGRYGKTLFVAGNEVVTADNDRLLLIPGCADAAGLHLMPTNEALSKLRSNERISLITYPKRSESRNLDVDGNEVFSLNTNTRNVNPVTSVFDLIWSFWAYPTLTIARHFTRPDEELKKFDEISQTRKFLMFGGVDAHSNLGVHLFGDDAGNKLINIKLDPYERILRLVRMHALVEKDKPLTQVSLLDAVRQGRVYIGFDVLGQTDGFDFGVASGGKSFAMGDEAPLNDGARMKATAPQPARFVVIKDGEKFLESNNARDISFDLRTTGVYRIEVYRTDLGAEFADAPWILSNPIYVR